MSEKASTSMSLLKVLNPNHRPNLFLQMESKREKIPSISREEYIPIFIVNLLRGKLHANDDSTSTFELSNTQLGLVKDHKNIQSAHASVEKWTDDSLIEEYAEFESSFLLTDENRKSVLLILDFSKDAIDTFKVDHREFMKCFVEEIEFPSMEVLCLLDRQYNLFSLSSYLMQLKHPSQIEFFKRQFLSFCFSPTHFDTKARERCTEILEHFIHTFIMSAYCNPGKSKSLENLEKISKDLLWNVTEKLVSNVHGSCPYVNHQFLLAVLQEAQVPNSVKKRYFSDQISQVLTSGSTSMALNEVLQYQERFANPSAQNKDQPFGDTIAMMIECFTTSTDVLDIIAVSLRSETKNWERILHLITEWIQKVEYEAASAVREIVKTLMKEGLSSRTREKVTLAFILARHCSLVAPKIFSRYERWYSNMFETELYSPAKEPEAFTFLANLLTDWIPVEPSCFLQVQATFWPYIPVGCRGIWNDYVSLAKVRVVEYNEVEGAMEFEPNPNNPVQHDVEMGIKAYENTRTMPQSIARMWMFRKQYYLDQFLPVLLKKPLGTALSDARLRLIEVLNKDGKIPTEMYVSYKNSRATTNTKL